MFLERGEVQQRKKLHMRRMRVGVNPILICFVLFRGRSLAFFPLGKKCVVLLWLLFLFDYFASFVLYLGL